MNDEQRKNGRYDLKSNVNGKYLVYTGYDIEGVSLGLADKPDEMGWPYEAALRLGAEHNATAIGREK